MEPKYEATIQYNEEILEKLNYMIYRLNAQKKIRIFCFLLITCIMVFISLTTKSSLDIPNGRAITVIFNIIIFIVMTMIVLRQTSAKVVAKNQTKRSIGSRKEPFQKVLYLFFEEYYVVVTSVARTEYKYDSIMELQELENLFVMYLDKSNILCIDFSLLNDNERLGIKKLCEEKTNLIVKKIAF